MLSMKAYERYGIEVGQVYVPADGSHNCLVVRDVHTYADRDDVVVFDEHRQEERRIDAYKLARVRYYLADFKAGEGKLELMRALREGRATASQQQRIAQLFQAMQSAMGEQQADVRRGRFMVDHGEWRYLDNEREGKRTWLCARVAPDADLSCKGTRARELDAAIDLHEKRQGNRAEVGV